MGVSVLAKGPNILAKLKLNADQFKKGLDSAQGKMSKVGDRAGRMGKKMTTRATLPILGLGFAAVRSFDQFDTAMNNSTAIMGDLTDKQLKRMREAALDVGKTTKIGAEQAAESYFFLASAGLNAEQSIAALPKVAAFAQAGNFDMATATDLATDAQSALGLASDDTAENIKNLTRVQDVLVGANTLANASVEQFATSLTRKAGASLRALNKDVEEGVAVLGVFADQGIKGERAGTILSSTLDELQDKARANADAFEAHGIRVFDADGEMRNMADIVADMEGALGGMSSEARNAAFAQLGLSIRSREGINALVGQSEAIREYEEELRNSGGSTDEVAGKQMREFDKVMSELKGTLTELAVGVGPILVDMLMGVVGVVMPLVKGFQGLDGTTQKIILGVLGLVAVIGPLLILVGAMAKGVTAAIAVVKIAAVVVGVLSIKIIIIIAVIALLVAAIIFLVKNWDKVWAAIKKGFKAAVDFIVKLFTGLIAFVKEHWEKFVFFPLFALGMILTAVVKFGPKLLSFLKRAFLRGLAIAIGFARSLPERVKKGFFAMIDFIKGLPTKIKEAVTTAMSTALDFILGLPDTLFDAGRSMIESLADGIKDAAGAAVDAAKDVVDEVASWFPFSPAEQGPFSKEVGWASLLDGLGDLDAERKVEAAMDISTDGARGGAGGLLGGGSEAVAERLDRIINVLEQGGDVVLDGRKLTRAGDRARGRTVSRWRVTD